MTAIYKTLLVLTSFIRLHLTFYGKAPKRISLDFKSDSLLQNKTMMIDGVEYTVINITGDRIEHARFYIKNQRDQVVYIANEEEGIGDFKIVDFNNDGYKDIVLDLMVADSGEQDLVLYDPK